VACLQRTFFHKRQGETAEENIGKFQTYANFSNFLGAKGGKHVRTISHKFSVSLSYNHKQSFQ
jgi:hypothetical protein